MTTYVLVHGAWAGSWIWKDFSRLLRAKGHDVYTPSLTGLGERTHLRTPETSLETHVTDVANVLSYEDLRDVVLVGHSYGGAVVTGVAEREHARIKEVVYLDAFVLSDGESVFDHGGAQGRAIEDGWKVGVLDRPPDPDATPEMNLRRSRMHGSFMPIHTLDQPVHLGVPLEKRAFGRTYIKASADQQPGEARGGPFWKIAERVRNDPAWRYVEIETTHNVQLTAPDELARVLLELA